jgi:hypothetical protein
VVADEHDRAPPSPVGRHAVEDPGHDVPVAHHLALALDDDVVELFGQPQVPLVDEQAVSGRPGRPGAVSDLGAEHVQRAERGQPTAGEETTAKERSPVERVHAEVPPSRDRVSTPSLGERAGGVGSGVVKIRIRSRCAQPGGMF